MRLLAYLVFALAATIGSAQVPTQRTISGNLSGVSTSANDLLQARFSLANCGVANPSVPGYTIIVPKDKVFTADSSGNFTGALWFNDQITCNLGFTTVYQVQFLRNNIPTGTVAQYRITGTSPWTLQGATPVATLPPVNLPASGYDCTGNTVMVGIRSGWTPHCAPLGIASVNSVLTQPIEDQTIIQPPGTTLQVSSLNNVLYADLFPGVTLGERIAAADAQLGSATGIISINSPGTISSPLTIRAGHAVYLADSITIAAPVTLAAGTAWTCSPQAIITAGGSAGYLFAQAGTAGASIDGCNVRASAGFWYLLHVTGTASDIHIRHVKASNVGLVDTGNSTAVTELEVADSSSAFDTPSLSNPTGVYMIWTVGARIHGNSFSGTGHGVQWWGGDAGTYALAGGLAGNYTISGNKCSHVGGACVWGSMGQDITVSSNQADTCGDVCFDSEGGQRVAFTGNVAKHCGNGCGAWFFSSRDLAYTGNIFEGSDSSAFLGKNVSVDPTKQSNINIVGNSVDCSVVCNALVFDAISELHVDNNQITNGIILPTSYAAGEVSITRNRQLFALALPNGASAIAAPTILSGGVLNVDGNHIRAIVTQPTTTRGISAILNDFNFPDYAYIRNNVVIGTGIGIAATSAGTNPSSIAYWHVEHNSIAQTGATAILHNAATANEDYRQTPDNIALNGPALPGATVEQLGGVQIGPTAGSIGAQVTGTLTWPVKTTGPYNLTCTMAGNQGMPAFVQYDTPTATSVHVTIQATTAAPAAGVVVCKQHTT